MIMLCNIAAILMTSITSKVRQVKQEITKKGIFVLVACIINTLAKHIHFSIPMPNTIPFAT